MGRTRNGGRALRLLSKLTDPLFAGAAKTRIRAFREAAMASAALAAAADGPVSLAQRHTLDQILESIENLRDFAVQDAIATFDGYVAALRDDPAAGRAAALHAVAALAGDAVAGPLLLRIAVALARADGAVAAPVRDEIAALAATLGLPVPALGEDHFLDGRAAGDKTVCIVLGNEKGGTGKSTTAMHVVVALLKLGHRVASIDLDGRQGTLSRYVACRAAFAERSNAALPMPLHICITESDARDREDRLNRDRGCLRQAFADAAGCRYLVFDTPGSVSRLSHLVHTHADILITPLNDSFLDVDALARIDLERHEVLGPSAYCETVWGQNERRVAAGRPPIDWVVMRNRLAHIDARNSRDMTGLLDTLADRLHFRVVQGFGERVVFRELFYRGLTLFDLPDEGAEAPASHRHARQEVGDLIAALGIGAARSKRRAKSARP